LKYHEWIERLGVVCVVGVGVLGALLFFPSVRHDEYHLGWTAIGLETLLAAGALLHHFDDRMAYAERAKQYQRMASLFAHASDLLGKFLDREDYENAVNCVRKIGKEALTENGDWVLLRRGRPLEVPHP